MILADPPGSGLFHKVRHDVMYARTEAEGKRRRHQVDTIVEGVGNNRMTANLDLILKERHRTWVDDAVQVSDEEAVWMARYMVQREGLFLGSSSCVNLVAAVKVARQLRVLPKKPFKMATMLCDSGQRHLTKFWNDEYLIRNKIFTAEELQALAFDNLDFIQ